MRLADPERHGLDFASNKVLIRTLKTRMLHARRRNTASSALLWSIRRKRVGPRFAHEDIVWPPPETAHEFARKGADLDLQGMVICLP